MKTYTPEQLAEVIRKHAMWLRSEAGGERANLAYANLTRANLAYANLTRANLTRANLAYANLTRTNLAYANLAYANLTDADLTRADLAYANLTDTDLTDADLTRANLADADLAYANLTDADLAYANLTRANLTGANLTGADLAYANLSYAKLRDIRSYNGTIGNMAEIKSVQLDTWPVTYTSTHMQIGCQLHTLAEWWDFNDLKINRMDSLALNWWRVWKSILQSIVAASPAVDTGYKPDEAAQ